LTLADEAGALVCPEGHFYEVRDGIPRFVSGTTYADPFGPQWKRYLRTQLDSHTGTTISKDRARRCLGEDLWQSLADRVVLECGCGAGRFTEVLLGQGVNVTSVDITPAVEANAANFPPDEAHRVAQADLRQLPFVPRGFDIVFCLGVVQHTPSPEQTVASLYEHVKPGGYLVFDHYTYRAAWFLSLSPLWRGLLRRLPPDRSLVWTDRIVRVLYPIHSRWRRHRTLLNRVSPVLTYFKAFPELGEEHQREWAFLDTHDGMTDWYKHFRTRNQILKMLESLGLEQIWCEHGGNGVEARGRRPLPRPT